MLKTSIYLSVEMDAASRGFDYENYLYLHKAVECYNKVISRESYKLVDEILNLEIAADYTKYHSEKDTYEKIGVW